MTVCIEAPQGPRPVFATATATAAAAGRPLSAAEQAEKKCLLQITTLTHVLDALMLPDHWHDQVIPQYLSCAKALQSTEAHWEELTFLDLSQTKQIRLLQRYQLFLLALLHTQLPSTTGSELHGGGWQVVAPPGIDWLWQQHRQQHETHYIRILSLLLQAYQGNKGCYGVDMNALKFMNQVEEEARALSASETQREYNQRLHDKLKKTVLLMKIVFPPLHVMPSPIKRQVADEEEEEKSTTVRKAGEEQTAQPLLKKARLSSDSATNTPFNHNIISTPTSYPTSYPTSNPTTSNTNTATSKLLSLTTSEYTCRPQQSTVRRNRLVSSRTLANINIQPTSPEEYVITLYNKSFADK